MLFINNNLFSEKTFMIKVYHVLHNLVPFVQLKKCEKHPWRNVIFSKVTGLQVILLLIGVLNFLINFSNSFVFHKLLFHMNENVSFQHVAFLILICYGNLHHKWVNSANIYFCYYERELHFFLSFILYLNIAKFQVHITRKFSASIFSLL